MVNPPRNRRRVLTVKPVGFLIMTLVLVGIGSAQQRQFASVPSGGTYELYSWQDDPDGEWNFSLFPSPSGVRIPADAVFSAGETIHGASALYRRIAALPAGSNIIWFDSVVGPITADNVKAIQRLKLPNRALVKKVRQYAESHHVSIEMADARLPIFGPGGIRELGDSWR
jgi:hypothetical protein